MFFYTFFLKYFVLFVIFCWQQFVCFVLNSRFQLFKKEKPCAHISMPKKKKITNEVTEELAKLAPDAEAPVPGELAQVVELRRAGSIGECLRKLDATARAAYDALPNGSLLVIPSLQGNAALLKEWHKQRNALKSSDRWTPLHENGLQTVCEHARGGMVAFAIKE